MTDTNLFADHNDDDNVNHLEALVGDGKKFRTVEDLAKGKAESDRYIATLTAQLDEARTEVQKRIALEDLKTAILERDNNNNQTLPTPVVQGTVVDADSIEELISKHLTAAEANKIKTANEQIVADTLTNTFGANARAELIRTSKEVGLSIKELEDLGQRNPNALFKLVGIGNQPIPNGGNVPRSSERIDSTSNGERNKGYYDKLKVSDPRAYWDKKTQIQMNKDAMRLKERFYS